MKKTKIIPILLAVGCTAALLSITPEPDSILRVFMVYKPLDQYAEIEEQILPGFERKGFAVVEWGGSCIE